MNKKEILENIKKEALDNHVPIIEDEPLKLIEVLLKIKKPNKILEVGTAVGIQQLISLNILLVRIVNLRLLKLKRQCIIKQWRIFI